MGQNNIEKRQTIRAIKVLLNRFKDGNIKLDECAEEIYALKDDRVNIDERT